MGRVIAIHPGVNLLQHLAELLTDNYDPENTLVLFPNKRPILFASRYIYEKLKKPCLLPKMQAFKDWCIETYAKTRENPETVITEYDQAWITYQAAKEVLQGKKITDTWDTFMDWAFRLSDLFNKFDEELCNPKDVEYPYPDAGKKARILLENLGRIYERYTRILKQKGLTTPSSILKKLAEEGFQVPERNIYIVGFYALTKAESKIFKRMYEEGAVILWHTDPDRLEPLYQRWKKEWNLSNIEAVASRSIPEIKLYQSHGLHPELSMLKSVLGSVPKRFDQKAIVLLSQSALIPLLHGLPNWEINITMGYPLKQTPLYAFITGIEEVIKSKHKNTQKYSSKALSELLMQPLISQWLELSKSILSKGAFIDPASDSQINEIFETLIFPYEKAKTPEDIADALLKILSFIHQHADESSPIEKGFVAKTAEVSADILKNSLFAKQPMSTKSLFSLLKKILERVSVPFEGEPLKGLQVMGILETRLLSFDEVFILDANEDVLPGVEEINPLIFWDPDIPDKDKLPERFKEEAIIRYHFRRLVASSKKVHIFWQQQSTPDKASLESKKEKSRYVEQIIWEKEKEEKRNLEDTLVQKSKLTISPEVLAVKDYLKKTEEHKNVLRLLLTENPVSASLIDLYISCPLKFYYEKLLKLEAPDEPYEVDLKVVGDAMHRALDEYYRSFGLPKKIKKSQLNHEELFNLFVKHLGDVENISPEKRFLLYETVKYRLKTYAEKHPEETEVLSTEKPLTLSLLVSLNGETLPIRLFGKIDRIDRREAEHLFSTGSGTFILILDYKTGSRKADWKKDILSFSVDKVAQDLCEEHLKFLREKLESIQLPLYAYLAFKNSLCLEEEKLAVAYVDLYRTAEEKPYVRPDRRRKDSMAPVEEFNQWITDGGFERLLVYIIKHILECPYWYPSDGTACTYCSYRQFCRYC